MPGGGITAFAASSEYGTVEPRLMPGGGITAFAASWAFIGPIGLISLINKRMSTMIAAAISPPGPLSSVSVRYCPYYLARKTGVRLTTPPAEQTGLTHKPIACPP